MDKRRLAAGLLAVLALCVAFPVAAQDRLPPYEAYYLYLYDYPDHDESGWSETAQGLAHDDNFWYITQEWEGLWKIPVTMDIAAVDSSGGAVGRVDLPTLPETEAWGHSGDPDTYEYGGVGYVLVPLEAGPGPALAIFRTSNLGIVGTGLLTDTIAASFVAVDGQGVAYLTDEFDIDRLLAYNIDWALLAGTDQVVITRAPDKDILFTNPLGQPLILHDVQGGEFSDGGEIFYLSSGDTNTYNPAYNGIHAFDVATGRQLAQSANGVDPFNYEYSPGVPYWEEPEGLTVWDLDDGRAPYMAGQLHVLVLQNEPGDTDDIMLKNYAHTIYVDSTYTDVEKGRYWDPFNTVGEAAGYAWDGARIGIRSATYLEAVTINRGVLVYAWDGNVTIGTGGQIRIVPGATVRLRHGGGIGLR